MLSRAKKTQPDLRKAHLVVAIPALNEERTIGGVIERIPREIDGVGTLSILVIDDGSTDRTGEVATRAGAFVERHPQTRGVGAAFGTALRIGVECGADLLVTIDADGQFDPGDIPKLVQPVIAGEADFTTGSRFLDPSLIPEDMLRVKRWGNRAFARIISSMAGQRIYDVSCGMRCYARRAVLELNPMASFTYTQEILLNLAFKHLRIMEVPIRVRGTREFGESRVAANVLSYGIRSVAIILRCYRDYKPMALFGSLAAIFGGIGLLLGLFLSVHYLTTGGFSPHKWAGFSSAALLAVAIQLFLFGVMGGMLSRHRIYLEELLYESRQNTSGEPEDDAFAEASRSMD
jgi:glycosyltransferase involved in cell wall biosynthesis